MPINMTQWREFFSVENFRKALDAEEVRWNALTPAQQKQEQDAIAARWEKARKHIAFLDYCVAKKIDPNLVLPIHSK